ncbi:tRNA (adenine-N(1))-methyltransferase [Paenibacillus sp. Marseille-P2973]|uniref:tRNA (adenine(22)-N(1))-methyltransferase n=1 Tax=Paenibacillus TaxID=44249 RepID=UPI001B3616A5|nr:MULTISPECIES: tRNA (adenine(22)-N(1))-methyltransferase TrmK [Paenibacillus]MBQ4897529.1 tRNA (adenine-N(1))-methyltransferase [Paenibacillus sp. Marseille-P2973]MDN4069811.1 tRNA (adenine(22)-N(1))-methyltransferase TrmK [Paenibacillus vini]
MKLSARLQHIADRLSPGCRLADIGSDHALLPVYAVQNGRASFAVAGEVNDGPLEAAKRQVAEAGESKRVSVRKGDGLAVVEPGEVDAITIAGMGGALIASILEAGKDKLAGVKRLVLQPNVGEDIVRSWLIANGWYLSEEIILEEDGKIYEILTAETGPDAAKLNDQLYSERTISGSTVSLTRDLLLLMGPHLTESKDEVWFAKWRSEIDKLDKIRQSVATSKQESSREKEESLNQLSNRLKEVLACLQKAKL